MKNEINQIWNATLYLRLSREDGDKEESNSITGQRELLRDYLKTHPELHEYTVQVDDGFSGSTFERPAFQAMLEDVKSGKTNCIIVKDLSRFGRNYLDAGEYIEKVFPFPGVRFIAVNDNYDSFKGKNASDDLIVPFKNLINEAYCRDISVKIRSQLEIKRKRGQFIGAFAVYGYMKDESDKNRLVVDEYAADIVRDIFKWKLEGVSPQDIAVRLNSGGILSPLEYKKSLGMNYATPFRTNAKAAWSAGNVLRILKNAVYTGVLTQGKEMTPSYKVHKRITKPEDEWTVIRDSHDAIISRADFDTVQKVLSLDTRRVLEDETVALFSGMVFCGECGASMVRKTVPSHGKKYVYYVCSVHKRDKSCSSHAIRDTELEEIVLTALRQYIREVIDMDTLLAMTDTAPLQTAKAHIDVVTDLEKRVRAIWEAGAADKKHTLKLQIAAAERELTRSQTLYDGLYQSLVDGIVTRYKFISMKENYRKLCEECEEKLNALKQEWKELERYSPVNPMFTEVQKFQSTEGLSEELIHALIKRIEVSDNSELSITFNYQDEFEALALFAKGATDI